MSFKGILKYGLIPVILKIDINFLIKVEHYIHTYYYIFKSNFKFKG